MAGVWRGKYCSDYISKFNIAFSYGILPPAVLSVVAYSILDALTFMKQIKIMHRGITFCINSKILLIFFSDIKRANVLVSFSGDVKLADMGLARILPNNSSVANTYLGDNMYMPPERMLGLAYRYINSFFDHNDANLSLILFYDVCSPQRIKKSALTVL